MSTVVIALAFALAFALAMTIAKAGFLAGKPAPAPETPETGATAPLDTAPPVRERRFDRVDRFGSVYNRNLGPYARVFQIARKPLPLSGFNLHREGADGKRSGVLTMAVADIPEQYVSHCRDSSLLPSKDGTLRPWTFILACSMACKAIKAMGVSTREYQVVSHDENTLVVAVSYSTKTWEAKRDELRPAAEKYAELRKAYLAKRQ